MISPSPTAPEGSVTTLPRYSVSDFPPSCAILCRLTHPLIAFAFSLLRRDVPCNVLGRDVGKGLTDLVKKLNATSIDDFLRRLEIWREREFNKALDSGRESLADQISDRAACLRLFCDNLPEDRRSISELLRKIDSLFADRAEGVVTLATIHKSKGLEWSKVFLLDSDLIPSRWAKLAWQRRQEDNLLYVAITRAKLDLVYITSNSWKRDEQQALPASGTMEDLFSDI